MNRTVFLGSSSGQGSMHPIPKYVECPALKTKTLICEDCTDWILMVVYATKLWSEEYVCSITTYRIISRSKEILNVKKEG